MADNIFNGCAKEIQNILICIGVAPHPVLRVNVGINMVKNFF